MTATNSANSTQAQSAQTAVVSGGGLTSTITDGKVLMGRVSWTSVSGIPSGKSVSTVQFSIDGVLRWTERYVPYVFNGDNNFLNSATLGDGPHALSVKVTLSNSATSTTTTTGTMANLGAPLRQRAPHPRRSPGRCSRGRS